MLFQPFSQVERKDCGRSLLRPQSVVVPGCGHSDTKQIAVFVRCAQQRRHESNKSTLLMCLTARHEQVFSVICIQSPIIMFATSVDSGEGLFMEENSKIVVKRQIT